MMLETMLLAAFFAVALVLEWRWRKASLRLATALVALVVIWYTQPLPRRAARLAIVAPPAERVAELQGGPLSGYESGVVTMERAVVRDAQMFANERLLALGVLMWLACSPALRRNRPSVGGVGSGRDEDHVRDSDSDR